MGKGNLPEVQKARAALKPKERTVAAVFEAAGRVQAMQFMSSLSEISALMSLRNIKESGAYKEIGFTWAEFCASIGIKRRTVDEKLKDIATLGEEFLGDFANYFSNDFNKIKQLGYGVSAGVATLEGNTIVYGDERVTLSQDNQEEVQALLDRINLDVETAQGEAADFKRISGTKDRTIRQMEVHQKKLEKWASKKDMSPEELAFLDRCEHVQTGFEGYQQMIEQLRDELGDDPTPREQAAFLALMTYMLRSVQAHYDTAADRFGPTDKLKK